MEVVQLFNNKALAVLVVMAAWLSVTTSFVVMQSDSPAPSQLVVATSGVSAQFKNNYMYAVMGWQSPPVPSADNLQAITPIVGDTISVGEYPDYVPAGETLNNAFVR